MKHDLSLNSALEIVYDFYGEDRTVVLKFLQLWFNVDEYTIRNKFDDIVIRKLQSEFGR
ncbi:MAG: hypothetical protein WD512_14360 [Candidatus Paceibacterota bacterium]